jgi:glycosyltransferase involved in cell wall biosynthesis
MVIGIDASRAFVDKPTGTERYAYEIITRMLRLPEAREHEWVLYVRNSPLLFPSLNLREGLGESYIKVVQIPLPYLWTQVGMAARTWIDNLDILWVPAHTLPVFRKPGIKTVVTIHGIEYEWLPAYENKLQRWYLPWSTIYAVKSATGVIAVSEFTKKQLIIRLNGDQKKIKVIKEGFDVSPSFIPPLKVIGGQEVILKKYGLLSKKYILFVGTVQPRKNLERLIEAFSMLCNSPLNYPSLRLREGKQEGYNLKLVIAGKLGWNYEGVLAAPKKFGVEDRVVISGYTDDYTRQILLNNALVYVQPSVTEGFGLPVLEAMAAGIPVVSSRGGALEEVVGDAGVLFDPFEISEMSHKMELVIGSHKLREELIEKGKKRVEEFGWDKAALETYKCLTA